MQYNVNPFRPDKYDPQVLDESLADLALAATQTRDAVLMGRDDEVRQAFNNALAAISKAVHQFSLKNRAE